jgi:hypothetical protein
VRQLPQPFGLENRRARLGGCKERRKRDTGRLQSVLRHLHEIERKQDGLIEMGAEGIISKEEVRVRLAPLDEDLGNLRAEAEQLASRQEREKAVLRDARMTLRVLHELAPQALDDLNGEGRREFYRDVGLKVLSNRDGSLRLSWLVDLEMGVIRWENGEMSTR